MVSDPKNPLVKFDAKQKYRGMFETQKYGNKKSSGEFGLNIRTLASPKVGQDDMTFIIQNSELMYFDNIKWHTWCLVMKLSSFVW